MHKIIINNGTRDLIFVLSFQLYHFFARAYKHGLARTFAARIWDKHQRLV